MSTVQGAVGGSNGARDYGPQDWAGASWRGRGCGASRWSAFEIVAMVLGFIVFWPIGLAILAFKIWQRRSGYPGDLQTAAHVHPVVHHPVTEQFPGLDVMPRA